MGDTNGLKILSLFDGMSCGMIAFKECGIKIDKYVAFEIDKFAIKTSAYNFPEIQQKGDVFKAEFTEYKGFDFLIGGSPCTYWSTSQTSGKREVTASGIGWGLFSQYLRALKEAKPRFFIYENNKSMSNDVRDAIRTSFGFDEICINSSTVSAQNRPRYYWVGKRNENGTYSKVEVSQPTDTDISLSDILESGISWKKKQNTLDANYIKGGNISDLGRQSADRLAVAEPVPYGSSTFDSIKCAINIKFDDNGIPIKATSSITGKEQPIYKVENGIITINEKQWPMNLSDGYYIIRMLTAKECARCQTVPDWFVFPVSRTQEYKLLGNGWTIRIIMHIIMSVLK